MRAVLEEAMIERLVRGLTRSPLQLNRLQESDSELLSISGSDPILAVTTDSIVEEIEQGLYDDPYQIGWMTITVNASDLAASAADPIGILVSQTLPHAHDERLVSEIQRGIRDACDLYSLPILGGDTNYSSVMQLSATAIGLVQRDFILTRRGCRPGEQLFASGSLGLGSSFALNKLAKGTFGSVPGLRFIPHARVAESRLTRGHASACMDTSDGMVATLDQLARLNNVGFDVEIPVEELLHPHARLVAEGAGIPPWMMLAGPHGEFELLFTVPPHDAFEFTEVARSRGWNPIEIGRVVCESGLWLNDRGRRLEIDAAGIRNLFFHPSGHIEQYLTALPHLAHPC